MKTYKDEQEQIFTERSTGFGRQSPTLVEMMREIKDGNIQANVEKWMQHNAQRISMLKNSVSTSAVADDDAADDADADAAMLESVHSSALEDYA